MAEPPDIPDLDEYCNELVAHQRGNAYDILINAFEIQIHQGNSVAVTLEKLHGKPKVYEALERAHKKRWGDRGEPSASAQAGAQIKNSRD